MGPASDNAGYGPVQLAAPIGGGKLQWVRRRITPVMNRHARADEEAAGLQWVRRRITPVMGALPGDQAGQGKASMGPASDNAGYVAGVADRQGREPAASMGPASDNAGYVGEIANGLREELMLQWVRRRITPVMFPATETAKRDFMLQWVRRRITPVMVGRFQGVVLDELASMGPASDNAGYGRAQWTKWPAQKRLQWVRRRITPVM